MSKCGNYGHGVKDCQQEITDENIELSKKTEVIMCSECWKKYCEHVVYGT